MPAAARPTARRPRALDAHARPDTARAAARPLAGRRLARALAALLAALALLAGLSAAGFSPAAPARAQAAEQYATVAVVDPEGATPYTVLVSNSEVLFSGEDLAQIAGFSYEVAGDTATLRRGAKTVEVALSGGDLSVCGTRMGALVPAPLQRDGRWYLPASQMIPWLNLTATVADGALYVLRDEVSAFDVRAGFDPAAYAFDLDRVVADLGDGSSLWSGAQDLLDGAKTSLLGEKDAYYDLLKEMVHDTGGAAWAAETYRALDLLDDVASDEDGLFKVLFKLESYGEQLGQIDEAFGTLGAAYGYTATVAQYALFFGYVGEGDAEKMQTLLLIQQSMEAPLGLTQAAEQVSTDFENYWPSLLKQVFSDVTNEVVDAAKFSNVFTATVALGIAGVKMVAETLPDWHELASTTARYDQLAAVGLDIYRRYQDGTDEVSLANARRGAMLYLYACQKSWELASSYALDGVNLEAGYDYAARADAAGELYARFLMSSTATVNDSLGYGQAADSLSFGKVDYANELLAAFAGLDCMRLVAATYNQQQLEYAILFAALADRGLEGLSWTQADADGDGRCELYVDGVASAQWQGRAVQLFADADGGFFWALPATYLDGSSGWECASWDGFTPLWRDTCASQPQPDGSGGSYDVLMSWDGHGWSASYDPGTSAGAAWLCDFGGASATMWDTPDAAGGMGLDEELGSYLRTRDAVVLDRYVDPDDDGVDEHLYLVLEDRDRWFGGLLRTLGGDPWGDLPAELTATDATGKALAVVVDPLERDAYTVGASYIDMADLVDLTREPRVPGNSTAGGGLVCFEQPDGGVRAFAYADGLLRATGDWHVETTWMLKWETSYDGAGTQFERIAYGAYDPFGNLLDETRWSGMNMQSQTYYTYDYTVQESGRLVLSETYATLTGEPILDSVTEYTYDDAGRLARSVWYGVDGGESSMDYAYDEAGRLVLRTVGSAGWGVEDGVAYTDAYTYDELGRQTSWTMRGADGSVWAYVEYYYTSDAADALPAANSDWDTFAYEYDENGLLVTEVRYGEDGSLAGWTEYEYAALEVRVAGAERPAREGVQAEGAGGQGGAGQAEGAGGAGQAEGGQAEGAGGQAEGAGVQGGAGGALDLSQVGGWEEEPPQVSSVFGSLDDMELLLNGLTASVVFPGSWLGRYTWEEWVAEDGSLGTTVYCQACFDAAPYTGELFTIMTTWYIAEWPAFRVLDYRDDGAYIVALFPTDVPYDPSDPWQSSEYQSLAADADAVLAGVHFSGW